ncbi:MAG: alpha/beta hydrolase [Opitutales bacterium]
MRKLLPLFFALAGCLGAQTPDPMPAVTVGRIERLAPIQSKFVSARNVDVWLPPSYDGKTRCPVIYMHDGQMLFDAAITWNKQSWHMAETMADLIRRGKIPPTIIVGIWSIGPQRFSEYFSEKALPFIPTGKREDYIRQLLAGKPRGDDYLRYLVQELKPAIDAKYATLPDREHTMTMGSSMGGVISLYAICEYPEIFGGAGCLSTGWTASLQKNAIYPLALFNYLQGHLPDPQFHRIYFDQGTATLDAIFAEAQAFADLLVRDHGYTDKNFLSRTFPGADHSEVSWAKRVDIPLEFLDGPSR